MKYLLLILCLVTFSYGNEIDTLTQLFERCGKKFGSTVKGPTSKGVDFETCAEKLGIITARTYAITDYINPDSIFFDYTDGTVNFCANNSIPARLHVLLTTTYPDWIKNAVPDSARKYVKYFCQSNINRYSCDVEYFDAVNHPFSGNTGQGLAHDWKYNVLGGYYIDSVLTWCDESDSTAKLFINEDYGNGSTDYHINKMIATLSEVKRLLNAGATLHGIGLQMHIRNVEDNLNIPKFKWFIDSLDVLGIDEIHITELDVAIDTPYTNTDYELQASLYNQVTELCLYSDKVTSLVVWGFTDAYPLVSTDNGTKGHASVLDTIFQPKPAYYEMKKVLEKEVAKIELENDIDTLNDMIDECDADMDTLIVECDETQDKLDFIIDFLDDIGLNPTSIFNKFFN